MKECAKVKRLLSRYLDKETSNTDTALVEAHLDICPFCKKEFSALARAKKFILEKERKTLPQDYLVYRLREKIASEQRVTKQGLSWLADMGNFSRKLIPVPVTAIVLSLAFLILSSGQQTSKYSLEEHMLSGTQTTTATALELILGAQNQRKGGGQYE